LFILETTASYSYAWQATSEVRAAKRLVHILRDAQLPQTVLKTHMLLQELQQQEHFLLLAAFAVCAWTAE
jgi:hypothetical protein